MKADDALDQARFGLDRAAPARSARRVATFSQIAAFALLGAGLWWAAREAPAALAIGAYALAWLLFAGAVLLRLFAAATSMTTEAPEGPGWTEEMPVYTILCPLYREAASAPKLVAALQRLDYPGIMEQPHQGF